MYINDLSKQTGASRKAIYLYEEMGLIPKPQRKGNYRVYDSEVVAIVQTIKCAQSLGFTLKELADALQGAPNKQWPNLDGVIERINRKVSTLREDVQALERQIGLLDALRQRLENSPPEWECETGR